MAWTPSINCGAGDRLQVAMNWIDILHWHMLLHLCTGIQPCNQWPMASLKNGYASPCGLHLLLLCIRFCAGVLCECLFFVLAICWCAKINHRSISHWLEWKAFALLAGLLCGFANGFQFMGRQAAGFAVVIAENSNKSIVQIWRASVIRSKNGQVNWYFGL